MGAAHQASPRLHCMHSSITPQACIGKSSRTIGSGYTCCSCISTRSMCMSVTDAWMQGTCSSHPSATIREPLERHKRTRAPLQAATSRPRNHLHVL